MQHNLFILGSQPNTIACFQERKFASGIYRGQER